MERREYIRIGKPTPLSTNTHHLKDLNDDDWKNLVFYHLLSFYKNYNQQQINKTIQLELKKQKPKIELLIAKFIRKYLRSDMEFGINGFIVSGETTNDEEVEGNYDIIINHSFWNNEFPFECKNLNLNSKKGLINKYVCYNKGHSIFDGGVYRYFNGKYAQQQNFGGMIGFVLEGDLQSIKTKIISNLNGRFDTSPNGDLKYVQENSIEQNHFTFNSVHNRFNADFILHHILFDFG